MKGLRSFAWLAIVLAVAACACTEDDDDNGTALPAPTAPAARWDASTVWQYSSPATMAAWQQACSSRTPSSLNENDPCIVAAMRAAGASQSAIDFFQAYKYFLFSFNERGRVDHGQGGAPWFNMGRPTPHLFLNGTPDIIDADVPNDYKTNASYAGLLAREPSAFPWLEYGTLTGSSMLAGGVQVLVIEYPLRICRACPDLGYIPVSYPFDSQGRLGTVQTLPFKPK
jgi:hypothetical protein